MIIGYKGRLSYTIGPGFIPAQKQRYLFIVRKRGPIGRMTLSTNLEFYNLNGRKEPVINIIEVRYVNMLSKRMTNDLFSHCHLLHQVPSLIISYALPR